MLGIAAFCSQRWQTIWRGKYIDVQFRPQKITDKTQILAVLLSSWVTNVLIWHFPFRAASKKKTDALADLRIAY
jgi:hypothetical protein